MKLCDAYIRIYTLDMVAVYSKKLILVTHLGRVDFLARAWQSSASVTLGETPGMQNAVLQFSGCCAADLVKIWCFSLKH